MNSWNGTSLFYFPTWEEAPDTSISSDTAGAVGFAAINRQSWFAAEWPPGTENLSIAAKCGNLAVVMLLCRGSC